MSEDLEQLIAELEEVSARMLATTCWEQDGEFSDLSAARSRLCAQVTERKDLDANAAERICAVIQAGYGLVARAMAMRESVLAEIAQAESQGRFARELGSTVLGHAPSHHLDMSA